MDDASVSNIEPKFAKSWTCGAAYASSLHQLENIYCRVVAITFHEGFSCWARVTRIVYCGHG